ncbi:rhodanese-like domain-containing protein [Roseibacillus persicicus]|uniref:Rhodanese domain-containing protein n=2 Tax=Roseibacillus persicicus TaxID=454148 RepID=A0A918WEQ1_9BACT|nr:rhodanese-like domain-containing protein [Roseibacillus persicicus]GHC39810.1 hypothetical protein GCM10007100_00050 [Roseibacillus persicicus]
MNLVTIISSCLLALTATAALMADEQKPKEEVRKVATPVLKAVTGAEAKSLVTGENAPIVIDIRTAEEFKEGHIEGAQRIEFGTAGFKDELAKLDKSKAYLFHCRSGGRSNKSLPIWKELGFQKLYHLDSGIQGWKKAGGEVVEGQ